VRRCSPGEDLQLRRCDSRARRDDDRGGYPLTPLLVVDAHDCAVRNAFVEEQRVFDLGRRDVLTAAG